MKNKFGKVFLVAASLMVLVLMLSSCSSDSNESGGRNSNKPEVVTSFYPLEFAAKEIAGEYTNIVNITPQGAEPHDIELTPELARQISDADLAIVMGADFQPAIEQAVEARSGSWINVFEELEKGDQNKATAASFKNHGDEDHSNENGSDKNSGNDPHIWLDPITYSTAISPIADEVVKLIPNRESEIRENAKELIEKLESLDAEFKTALKTCELNTFVTSHDAFSYMANRYNLKQESIAGIDPESEPTPARLSELKTIVNEKKIDVVFTEELVSKKIADTLSREAGVKTEVLSPLEGLSETQIDKGEDYFSVMRTNLSRLARALRCDATV